MHKDQPTPSASKWGDLRDVPNEALNAEGLRVKAQQIATLDRVHGMREVESREREDLRDAHAMKMHVPPPRIA